MSIVTAAVLLFVVLATYGYKKTKLYTWQYAYFLRIPILVGISMWIFPIYVQIAGNKVFQNWFELDTYGLVIVTWLSVLVAWSVMHLGCVLYVYAPCRTKLSWQRAKQPELIKLGCEAVANPLFDWLKKPWARLPIFGLLLASPNVVVSYLNSYHSTLEKVLLVVLGVVFAAIIAWLAHLFRGLFGGGGGEVVQEEARLSAEGGQPTELDPADRPSSVTTQGFTKKAPQYLSGKAEGFFGHTSAVAREAGYTWLSAAGLLVVFGTLYAVLGPVLHPESSLQDIVPAIAYVLVLMVLVAATLSFFTLWLDKYRIPLLTAVIFTGIFAHSGTGLDHFFAVETPKSVETATESEQSERSADAKQKNGSELVSAFDAWNSTHSTIPVATVITASGGGITAAYWSALVLANLSSEMDENLDFEFGSSVVAVSSVSGGAVGTMGFVRAFDQVGVPNSDDLEELVAQAGRSSLGAVGWGLVYPDFWRILLPDWMNPGGAPHDRGWALERRWSGISDVGDETLCSWRYETLAGWRPVAFLNATVVETGERLVLSPLNTNASGDRSKIFCQAGKFHELCPGYDIKVVTAARLSSTFPYVSPISRPEISEVKYAYHVADGGYYDNFGVLTALDYLRVTEERIKAAKRKILLIQIRLSGTEAAASAKAEAKTPEASKPGYLSIFIGPVTTLMNVRTPSQIARNDQFVEELIKDWGKDQVKTVTFTLGRDAPLSWHLSDSDKDSIAEAWCSEANRDQLEQLKKFLGVMPEQAKKSIQCDG